MAQIHIGKNFCKFVLEMVLTLPYFYSLAAALYINTCLVVAAVRWFHMCRPYDRNPHYYYPGRPFVTAAWLSSLTLIPYVLDPMSADAWFLARVYFLPMTLFHFTLLLFSYFGNVMEWKQWRWPTLVGGIPVVLLLLTAMALAIVPGDQLGGTRPASYLLYIVGLIITALCLTSIAVVMVWSNRFDPDDYSNPSDFPVIRARRWLMMIVLNAAFCWTGALLDNPTVLAILMLVIAAFCVVTVITALHPNRNRPPEEPAPEPPAPAEEATQVYNRSLPRHRQEEILSAIITVVEEMEAFLDPHLTLQDVADRCGYNRTYISGMVKTQFGGFSDYINRLRLNYVDNYLKQHPDATLSEAIDAAGFGSRSRYYDFKAKLQGEK